MRPDLEYAYAGRNLLDEPHHYMYTPFEGAAFLGAYLDHRERLAARDAAEGVALDREISAALAGEGAGDRLAARHRDPLILPEAPPGRAFVTADALDDCCAFLTAGDAGAAEPWLRLLGRRFEVTKRLFARYGADGKPAALDHRDLDPYAVLAAALLLRHRASPSLVALNAALKLVDLLSSAPGGRAGRAGALLPAVAGAEAAAVRALMAEQRVTA